MPQQRTITTALVLLLLAFAACSTPAREREVSPPGLPQLVPSPPSAPLTDADLVVAPDGTDDAPGNLTSPLRTIGAAARRAQPGMIVLVRDGIYTGDITTEAAGTPSARIAYLAESPNVRIIGVGDQDGVWENTGDYVDIIGFSVSGLNVNGIYDRGSAVRIMQNRVDAIPGNCIYAQNEDYSLADIQVIGNVTSNCGLNALDHGIYVTNERGVVANNIAYGSTGFGIQCWHACNNMSIANNLVFGNKEGGIVLGGENSRADNSFVVNNIAVANGREGIREGGESGSNNQFLKNLLWGNERDRILIKTGAEQGTIVADPQFVNFQMDGTGDYRLQPASPGVRVGTAEKTPPVAIDGRPRPRPGGVDLGPYQR